MSKIEKQKLAVENQQVRGMSPQERAEAQMRVAMSDPKKLRAWLEQSGRVWMVFNGIDLVDALSAIEPFPAGPELLKNIIQCYAGHRYCMETGRFEEQEDPRTGEVVKIPIMKTEMLEVEEYDRAIRYLIGRVMALDPNWSLDNAPL